jgi:hypothetical protein
MARFNLASDPINYLRCNMWRDDKIVNKEQLMALVNEIAD